MATMTADEYRKIVKAIINTATGGSAGGSYPWTALNRGNYSAQDFYDLMQTRSVKNAGYDAILNADGSVRTYTYINKNGQIADLGPYDDIAGAFNSNHQTGTASGGTIPYTQPIDTSLTVPTETETAAVKSAGTMTKYADSVKGAGNFVFGSVLPAIGAAATGVALGKIIDKTIYEVGTNVFGADNLEAFNPDTWGSITAGDDSLGAKAFNTIFGIDPDNGNTQLYLDENALAYLTAYMGANDFYKQGTVEMNSDLTVAFNNPIKLAPNPITYGPSGFTDWSKYIVEDGSIAISPYRTTWENETDPGNDIIFASANNTGRIGTKNWRTSWGQSEPTDYTWSGTVGNDTYEYDNKKVYFTYIRGYGTDYKKEHEKYYNLPCHNSGVDNNIKSTAWTMIYGNMSTIGVVNGVTNQIDSTQFDPSNITDWNDISSVLNALKNQYPELWNNRVENNVVQPDGTTKTYTYIPVPMPTGGTADKPTTDGAKQSQPEVDPSTATDTLLKTLVQILTQTKPVGMTDTPTNPINPNPPNIGGGDTPVVVVPTGSASALYTVYNPTQQQLSSFGAWLWSADFVDQIKKLFNDPMQSIIGLHKIFCTPTVSGSSNIKVGYLDSGVASKVVSDQYTTLSCGSVDLAEYFGNIFDYSPYTDVSLYLPFVGIVRLNVADVMRATLTVTYHFDVLTGACPVDVKVTRDSYDAVIYQYTGNAAAQYPLSSGSYMGILSGILSIAGGIAGTVATGGTAAPLLIGSAASALSMKTKVERSGSLSGNAGAMGIKIPYLIISRPQTALANNYQNYVGIPANQETLISDTTGFVKYDVIHLTGVSATEKEKSEIQTLFSQGVLI